MLWFNTWWVWMVAALVLAIAEVLIPGWIFFGFAVGAFFLGAMIWLGIGAGMSLAWSLVIFAVLSLLAYIVMRQMFGIRRGQVKIWDRDIND
jgi:membrane protein implicated in regulation of membrane protease activity